MVVAYFLGHPVYKLHLIWLEIFIWMQASANDDQSL